MEVVDGVLSMGKVGNGFPGIFGVLPMDEALEASGILDVIDFVFLVTIHEVRRWWWRGNLIWKDSGFERA